MRNLSVLLDWTTQRLRFFIPAIGQRQQPSQGELEARTQWRLVRWRWPATLARFQPDNGLKLIPVGDVVELLKSHQPPVRGSMELGHGLLRAQEVLMGGPAHRAKEGLGHRGGTFMQGTFRLIRFRRPVRTRPGPIS